MRNRLLILPLLFSAFAVQAQIPSTNIILFDYNKPKGALIELRTPRFLTAFNRNGYNNQPAFFSKNKLYLTTQSPRDTSQTDILALDIALLQKEAVTNTDEAEYSPTLMSNSASFSCIRVDTTGAQNLWAYPIDRSDGGQKLFPWLDNIGYHCWLDANKAALFLVGTEKQKHRLVIADAQSHKTEYLISNPGRCLAKNSDNQLLFIAKATEQTWFLKKYDPKTKSSTILISTRKGSEDFCLLSDGTILMGEGAKLYQYNPASDTTWKLAADLSIYGVEQITRMANNGFGKLALVVE